MLAGKLFFQIDVLNIFNGAAEKACSEAAEFVDGIGGEKLDACGLASLFGVAACGR